MKAVAVIGSAAFVGVLLTIGFGLGSFFILSEPGVFERWFADYFVFLLIPVFITSLPAFVGTIAMMRRSATGSATRVAWRNALIGLIVTYGVTSVVSLPLNIAFWSFTLSDTATTTALAWWMVAHVVRTVSALIAMNYAYRAALGTARQHQLRPRGHGHARNPRMGGGSCGRRPRDAPRCGRAHVRASAPRC